jgi:hypothetical protein
VDGPAGAKRPGLLPSTACIASGGLHVDLLEGSGSGDLAIGYRIGTTASSDTELIEWMAAVQGVQHVEEGRLVHRLGRTGNVHMALP